MTNVKYRSSRYSRYRSLNFQPKLGPTCPKAKKSRPLRPYSSYWSYIVIDPKNIHVMIVDIMSTFNFPVGCWVHPLAT